MRRRLVSPLAVLALVVSIGIPVLSTSSAVAGSGAAASPVAQAPATGRRANWPCVGCTTYVPPTYVSTKPTAILVALHGDEGNPAYIESVWEPIAAQFNVILFAPLCPTNLGCRFSDGRGGFTNSWWGWLQYSPKYDDAWIGNQVDVIAKSYNLDPTREFLTGWSGGADYLGWYAPSHSNRFAAANFVVGAVPYDTSCPVNKAAYFLMGSNDFRYASGQPSQVKSVYDRCGATTRMVVIPGADHQGTVNALTTQGYARKIMRFFMRHPLVK
jgi:poly(3-hydroxybutyrate) depolymerase